MLKVCCAVIENAGKFHAFRRGSRMKMPGKWEFPGGKIQNNETPEVALHRELLEELAIQVQIIRPLIPVVHHYPEFSIELIPFLVNITEGEITLLEHDAQLLGTPTELAQLNWAEADLPVLKQLD